MEELAVPLLVNFEQTIFFLSQPQFPQLESRDKKIPSTKDSYELYAFK